MEGKVCLSLAVVVGETCSERQRARERIKVEAEREKEPQLRVAD